MATKLTALDKMTLWHEGKRSLNIKACSNMKITEYLTICCDNNFDDEAKLLFTEIFNRIDIKVPGFNIPAEFIPIMNEFADSLEAKHASNC